jgi:hypothetical protein
MRKIIVIGLIFIASTVFADVVYRNQNSKKATKTFYDLSVVHQGANISIDAGKFYSTGKEYNLPAVNNEAFPDGSRLFVESDGAGGVQYYKDTTGEGEPVSLGQGIGSPLVAWRVGDTVNVLHSVED